MISQGLGGPWWPFSILPKIFMPLNVTVSIHLNWEAMKSVVKVRGLYYETDWNLYLTLTLPSVAYRKVSKQEAKSTE